MPFMHSRTLCIPLLLFLNALIRHSVAQSQTSSIQATTPINSIDSTSSHVSSSTTTTRSSYLSTISHTSATSTFSDVYPSYTSWPSPTPSSNSSNNNNNNDNGFWSGNVSSYYYIFIGVFILAGLLVLWVAHRRRRLRQLRRRDGRQNALLQDAAGWPNNRRWIHGNRTGAGEAGGDGVGSGWLTDRNEGLDERGEAPPPYKPANEADATVVDQMAGEGSSARGSGEIAVPPRVAHRSKPPEYEERRVEPV